MGISSYWSQMFILPKRVIKRINDICRSFLWFGIVDFHKPGNVTWKEVCKPKKCRGVGIRDVHVWNQVVLGEIYSVAHLHDERLFMGMMGSRSLHQGG